MSLTASQVITNLENDLTILRCWLMDNAQDGTSPLFREKARAYRDKLEELNKFKTIKENERQI